MKLSLKVLLTVLLAPSVFGEIIDKSKPTKLFHKMGKKLDALQNNYRVRNVEENVDDCCSFDGNNTDSSNDSSDDSNANTLSPSTSPTTRSEGISNAMFNIYTALGTTTVDLTAATYCSWNGVTCDSDNIEPTSIALAYNYLTGSLATDIGMITELTELDLAYNLLTGTLPAELGKNTLLSILSIEDNLISGPVPEALNELASLMVLNLYENMLTGPLPDLSGLSILDYLEVDYNMLTGTINPLKLPSNLIDLWLSANEFTGSIPDVSGFSALSYLILYDNALSSSIPDDSEFPSSLDALILGGNDLTGALPDLSSLSMMYFWVDFTLLDVQPLPSWLFLMNSLLGVSVEGNQFTGTIPHYLYTSDIEIIFLSQNQLTGTIGSEIGFMTDLEIFDISDNDFTQNFSPAWAPIFNQLTALEEFRIGDNNFGGTLMYTLCDIDEFDYEGTSVTHICPP